MRAHTVDEGTRVNSHFAELHQDGEGVAVEARVEQRRDLVEGCWAVFM